MSGGIEKENVFKISQTTTVTFLISEMKLQVA